MTQKGTTMECPDLDRLIDLYHGHRDPEMEAHIQTCTECQESMEILLALPLIWSLEVTVPDGLVERTLERIFGE